MAASVFESSSPRPVTAVEGLIRGFSEAAAESRRRGLGDPLPADPHDVYRAAVTVTMRVVFLLFAEERGLLPRQLSEHGYGISEGAAATDDACLLWHRLVAAGQTLHHTHGGSLFAPDDNGALAVAIPDRVMRHVFRAATFGDETDMDVERIGHIYESLLGYSCTRIDGTLLVTATPSRRNAGAHYTPRALAEEVVRYALEPQCFHPGPHQTDDRDAWRPRGSEEILGLRVADIAAGSGAFLVAAARYLADRLTEAWIVEDPTSAQHPDLRRQALRRVVASCLYGADINGMAVEMCKLSLWLVAMDPDLPFSFLDHRILHGNSLLGITDPHQFHAIPIRSPHDVDVRTMADGVIAAGLRVGGRPGRALTDAYRNLGAAVTDPDELRSIIHTGLTPTVPTDYEHWKPVHWMLDVPEVIVEHGGFDAIIGNPPFLGGSKLTAAMGTNVRDWFVHQLARGRRGTADLVAYFFLRAFHLLRPTGTIGLIATNTIAQGDTREVGLDQLVAHGLDITRATRSRAWPAATANLEYAAVWGTRAPVADGVTRVVDGTPARRISTLLEATGRLDRMPVRLTENEGIAFIGIKPYGQGFVIPPDRADAWISGDARNRDVLFAYLNGDDLNSRPDCSASRWVIDFYERGHAEAEHFVLPFEHIRRYVKPERDKQSQKALRERWWQHEARRPRMRAATAPLREVLVMAQVSKTVMPARVPTGQAFDQKLCVFATDSYADQAVLCSSIHQVWAIRYSPTMRLDVSYAPSDAFLTFPRPTPTEPLAKLGEELDVERRVVMTRRNLGLTDLYNLVNDPDTVDADVTWLRDLHVRIDEAVTSAYGWSDLFVGHGFHTYRRMRRWTVDPPAREEILDRLLAENLRRAAAQPANGSHA